MSNKITTKESAIKFIEDNKHYVTADITSISSQLNSITNTTNTNRCLTNKELGQVVINSNPVFYVGDSTKKLNNYLQINSQPITVPITINYIGSDNYGVNARSIIFDYKAQSTGEGELSLPTNRLTISNNVQNTSFTGLSTLYTTYIDVSYNGLVYTSAGLSKTVPWKLSILMNNKEYTTIYNGSSVTSRFTNDDRVFYDSNSNTICLNLITKDLSFIINIGESGTEIPTAAPTIPT